MSIKYPSNDWYPWYTIVWKAIWILPTVVAKYVLLFFIAMLRGWWSVDFKTVKNL